MELVTDSETDGAAPTPFAVLKQLEKHMFHAGGPGGELSVIVAGLDSFRMVTDYLGPVEADSVLEAFASGVGRNVEQVIHLGGEQLLGVLPRTCAADAATPVDKLRGEISSGVPTSMGRLTASVGVAEYPGAAANEEELIFGAQSAMYWAMPKGGNRTGYWGEMIGTAA